MKKKFLTLLSIIVLATTLSSAEAKQSISTDLADAIKLYKAGNYSECLMRLNNYVEKDPANALAFYYLAMTSAQVGRQDDAISNYEKVLTLTPEGTKLFKYASKGKLCLEDSEQCKEEVMSMTDLEKLIQGAGNFKSSDKFQSDYERLKIENLMREINRNADIDPRKFKEYKDFSSMNPEGIPTNDEIVAALRVLQKAGLGNFINHQTPDLSMLTGNSQQQSVLNMMGNSSMNPQMIQALFTNNMSLGF